LQQQSTEGGAATATPGQLLPHLHHYTGLCAFQRGGPHFVAVIGMEDQRLGPTFAGIGGCDTLVLDSKWKVGEKAHLDESR